MKLMNSRFASQSAIRSALTAACGITLALGGLNQAWGLPGTTNLAVGKTATATGADFGTSIGNALDGNRDGNFGDGSLFYENAGTPPLFYQVDLGANEYIDRVQLLRRTDGGAQNVFGNMNLSIFPDDGSGNPSAIPSFSHNYQTTSFTQGTWGTVDPGASAPGGAYGRFVRIERIDNNYWLTFAEFEVIGRSTPLKFSEASNIAVGKPVTTSSPPGFGALITSGNDGNIVGDFNDPARPVYHSNNFGAGEYWQVDLGKETPLDYAELFARSDSYTTNQFKVSVLNSALSVVGSVIVNNSDPAGTSPDYDHTIDLSGLAGRYLRVETTGEQYLSFTEFRAFAAVPEPSTLLLAALGLFGVIGHRVTRR